PVGIDHHSPSLLEQGRDCRLPRADASREAHDEHLGTVALRETSPHPRRSCRAREPVEWGRPDLVLVAPGLIWVMPAVTLLSHFGHQRAGLEPERTAMSDAIDRRSFLGQGLRTAAGVAVLGGGASSLLAACSSGGGTSTSTGTNTGASTATPKPGGSITFATEAEIDGFDPTKNRWDTTGYMYAHTVYDQLATFDANGNVKPYL